MVRIGFIGCHDISFHCLKKILYLSLENRDTVEIVFDLITSESLKHSAPSNFNPLQNEYAFTLNHVKDVSDNENISLLNKSRLDILFIIGWHRIVPQAVLDTAKITLGIHSSLLPKNRGSSPLNWQLIRGETKGGVTLFHLTEGVDSGPIVDQKSFPINFKDDIRTLYDKAIAKSLELLENNWNDIHQMHPKKIFQDESKSSFNNRRKPEDGLIDWTKNSIACYNFIRGLTIPYPGAFTFWNKKKIFIWESKISKLKETIPGEVLESGSKIIISTGLNSIEILKLQVETEPVYNSKVFSKIYNLKKSEQFT